MKHFLSFLLKSKETVKIIRRNGNRNIHIVIGNESCDLDSTISSLALAFLLDSNKNKFNLKFQTIVLPILNIQQEHFDLRTENVHILKECGIGKNLLIFRDQIDLEAIVRSNNVTTTLVDHHVLSQSDEILKETVIQIFDHRPVDPTSKWQTDKTRVNIREVGSCSTLIAQEFLMFDGDSLCKELGYMLYETIIFDTLALRPEIGKAKDLDMLIGKKLEDKFDFNEDRKAVFDKLWQAHNNVSHLTPKQLLFKDLKVVQGIPIPGLPMLVEDYLKLDGAHDAISAFCEDSSSSIMLLIGLCAAEETIKRDAAVFWTGDEINQRDELINQLKNSEQTKGYNFCLTEVETQHKDVLCFRQNNTKLTRKQIIPIIKECFN